MTRCGDSLQQLHQLSVSCTHPQSSSVHISILEISLCQRVQFQYSRISCASCLARVGEYPVTAHLAWKVYYYLNFVEEVFGNSDGIPILKSSLALALAGRLSLTLSSAVSDPL